MTRHAMAEVYLVEHNHYFEQEEETQKENSARDLPRSEAVLDDADSVLAVGERRRRD
jgi:hypothetical protein